MTWTAQFDQLRDAVNADQAGLTAQNVQLTSDVARLGKRVSDLTAQLAAVTPAPSGLPAVRAGWQRVAGSDFSDGTVPATWGAYPSPWKDSSGHGVYRGKDGCSVTNGILRIGLDVVGGTPRVTTLEPYATGTLSSALEFRCWTGPTVPGWKFLGIGWPVSNRWPAEGEIDWPEGNIGTNPGGFMHWASATGGQDTCASGVNYTTPTTYRVELLSGKSVSVYRDGILVRTFTKAIPNTPFTWRLQAETSLDGVVPTAPAAVFIDYVSVEVPA